MINETLVTRIKELHEKREALKKEIIDNEATVKRIQQDSPKKLWQYDITNASLNELIALAKHEKIRLPKNILDENKLAK